MQEIRFEKATSFKQKPQDESKLGFGKLFTDYMFEMDYEAGKGWHDPRVVPYHNFSLDPATSVKYYCSFFSFLSICATAGTNI